MSNLKVFCGEVLKALETGENPNWFSQQSGLCYQANKYDRLYGTSIYAELRDVLTKIYGHGLGSTYPFDGDSPEDYHKSVYAGSIYRNSLRLAFLNHYANT